MRVSDGLVGRGLVVELVGAGGVGCGVRAGVGQAVGTPSHPNKIEGRGQRAYLRKKMVQQEC